MKPNVFLRSMFRQPVRVFLLAAIVGIAAFAFSLRASESTIVNSEIARIEAYFRSVGFLTTADPDDWFNFLDFDDNRWQDIISQSPYVEHIDHRRLVTGELEGIMNADIDRSGFRYIPQYPTYLVRDAYFIGTVLNAREVADLTPSAFFPPQFPDILSPGSARAMGVDALVELLVHVDEVIMAYPEYAQAGRRIFLMVPYDEFAGIDVGGQYLFRGFWDYDLAALAGDESIPEFGYEGTDGFQRLGNGGRSFRHNSRELGYASLLAGPLIPQGDIYWAYYGSPAFDDILVQLSGYLEILERNLSAMIAVTTKDMYAMHPHESNAGELRGIGAGRLISYEDYQSANAVAVVHSVFAGSRGLSIGDTIELTLRENVPLALPHDYIGWQEYRTYTLSLEIIGIYRIGFHEILYNHPDITWSGYDPRIPSITIGTPPEHTVSTFLYIPDSIIPEDFAFYREPVPGDNLFSFLVNSRNESAFVAENRDALFEFGLTLHFASNPFAATFFESADAITEALRLNFVVFTIAAVFALVLAAFIYTMLMRRSFAISRVLGTSAGASMRQMFFSASLVWLPVAIVGTIIGFNASIDVAQESLVAVYDLQPHLQADPIPSRFWLLGLIAISSATTMLSALVGSFVLAKRPLLRILARR